MVVTFKIVWSNLLMKKSIVFIKDERDTLDALKQLLEHYEFTVLGFENAEEFFSFKDRPDHRRS